MNRDYTPETPPTESEPLDSVQPESPKKPSFISLVFDVVEMFAWSAFAVLIIFSFAFRLCRVDGGSMENTLYDGQNLILYSLGYTPEQNDIIVFHLTKPEVGLEKTLVKRVIATEGQKVEIDFKTATVTIDGKPYEDAHATLKDYTDRDIGAYLLTAEHHYDASTRVFSATVPEGHVFVMGDNRNNSKDSRDSDIAFVDTRCILGKAVLRVSPFTLYSE